MHRRSSSYKPRVYINKITFFIVGSALIAGILVFRMFQLQIIEHDKYEKIATQSQLGLVELPAQRGEIIIKDYHSEEEFLIATNTTLKLLYADPTLIDNPAYMAEQITPHIFEIENERAKDDERIRERAKTLAPELTEEEIEEILRPLSDTELELKFKEELITKLSQKLRPQIILATEVEDEILEQIPPTPGIEIIKDKIYAYPAQISNRDKTAEKLGPILEIPTKRLSTILKGQNRYVVLKRKLDPDTSDTIEKLIKEAPDEMLRGLAMQEEYFRYYPEGTLAANVIGYTNHENIGQYGIESSFNTALQGEKGQFKSKKDSIGRQITVGESVLNPAVDGDDIILTLDRSIQLHVDRILEEAVKYYDADSGQVLIMNPQSGAITAMSHYPSFDPNNFGEVFKKVEVSFSPEEMKDLFPSNTPGIYYFYTNPITLDKYTVFEEKDEEGNSTYYRYENYVGPEVYHNKIVSWPYEPGSVFKSIAMAIAIDDGDVTPKTTYNDSGPIGVDFNVYTGDYDFQIKNADGYFGLVDMSTVLAESLNTGMTFVAKRIGKALFYNYMKKFGLLDRTDIEFDGESPGKIDYFENWTESELATHSFGQGMTITMLQMVNAYSAMANGGILMQPYIVDEIRHDDGTSNKTDPHEIRRVLSEESSDTMTAMLVNAVENGVAKNAQVPKHLVAGKTGTSQTYKHGIAQSGPGTTITTFAGYGPVDNPQFVVLVKMDRPRRSEWGSATAAPTFSKIAEFLFDYYNIAPDK